MDFQAIELWFLAGSAAFLVFSFTLAAIAFTRWRRAARRDSERVTAQMNVIAESLGAIERRMGSFDHQLAEITRRMEAPPRTAPVAGSPSPSYPIAIRLARNGATAEELMESCGLGRQEAELARRLHGPGKHGARAHSTAA